MRQFFQPLAIFAVLWLTVTLVFFALRFLPGDAVDAKLAEGGASREQISAARARLGLDDPISEQYGQYLVGLVHGDLGVSLVSGRPVMTIITEQLAPTIWLALSALLIAVVLGLLIGVMAAMDGLMALGARFCITLALSLPLYWTGTLLVILFTGRFSWLPTVGIGSPSHLILPATLLGFHTMGGIARVVQANVRAVRFAQHVQVALSKGLPPRIIWRRHILRLGFIPVLRVIALQAGFLLGGTVITETLFVRPGLGRVLLNAVMQQDYPVVQGLALLAALVYTALNTAADVLTYWLDPRLMVEAES